MGWELLQGDAIELLRSRPSASVDTVVTDPPYFVPARHYAARSAQIRSLSDLSMLEHFYRDVWAEIGRVLKPTGFAYCFCDGQSYPVFYAMAYQLFKSMRPLVWDKMTSVNGYGWRHQHELIMFCDGFESAPVRTGDGDVIRLRAVPMGDRVHPAEKPVELLRALIKKVSAPGAVVLDPFAGSCATGLAALAENCSFVGFELESRYHQIGRDRLVEAERQLVAATPVVESIDAG